MKKEYVIYKATNKINGKLYVGKTYNFEKRKREHFYDIDNNLPFHRALKKYGKENFEWEIIDTAKTEKEIIEKEIYWIKKLNTCIHSPNSNGYNITLGGEGGVSWNSRPIVQFDLNGKYVDEYLSCSHASNVTGIGRHNIGDCANKITKQSGGFQWRYKDECDNTEIEAFQKNPSPRRKRIIQLDLDGNLINIFDSVTEASNKLNIGRTTISSCLTKKLSTAGGYQWIYNKDYDFNNNYRYQGIKQGNGIVQLNDNWKIINHFRNCSEAARYLGEPTKVHKQIHKALASNKRCRGFYWRKYDDYIKTQYDNTEVTVQIAKGCTTP